MLRTRIAITIVGFVSLSLLLPGCATLPKDLLAQPTATPPVVSNRPAFEVKRGTIAQTVSSVGRVAAAGEVTLYFKQSGRLKAMHAEPNQTVKKGDILAELETSNLQTQLEQAKLNLEIAQIQLAQTTEKADSDTTAASQAKVAEARALMEKAQADYLKTAGDVDKLRGGAAPLDLRAAEQAVLSAEATYYQAQVELARVKSGPTPETIRAAEFNLQRAENSLWAVQISRDAACGTSNEAGCRAANASVAAAQTTLSEASAKLQDLKAGPKAEDIAKADKSVASAKASLDLAQSRLDEVKAGAKPDEVATAERTLAASRSAFDAAKANFDLAVTTASRATTGGGKSYDTQLREKQVDLARVSIRSLEEQISLSQIAAPFDGVVSFAAGREGESITSFTPVVVVTDPKALQIAVDLSPSDLSKIRLGQEATIVLADLPSRVIRSKVVSLPSSESGLDVASAALGKVVRLDFQPPNGTATPLGSLANVTISVANRENVLIVPTSAVRSLGDRKFVRVVSPTGQRDEIDVQVGISNGTDTEILRGLVEGQKVLGQ